MPTSVFSRGGVDRPHRRCPTELHENRAHHSGDGVAQGSGRGVALPSGAHRDPRAPQPTQSSCGRYVIAFNVEIYNFRALRRDLESRGVKFRTTSDTEVILALFAAEGEAMLPKLHGMFALAIWDCVARRAFIARDPYGIKPLYITAVSYTHL